LISLDDYHYDQLVAGADKPIWISDDESLATGCNAWSKCPVIALDTEFIRTRTYYPIPGLIQLADNQNCYLIDPLAISDWNPLRALLVNPDVLKVLHAPSEDIELFRHSYQVIPQPVFDTQIGAAFAGWGHGRGLQKLLKLVLDIDLDKEETRSDWLQRPLTPKQERYAALDVAHLAELYRRIQSDLDASGRGAWVAEETDQLIANVSNADAEIDNYYQRFSQLWNLPEHRLASLRDLCSWRERIVRETDRTRNSVLSNNLIVETLKRWPRSMKDLAEIKEMRGSVVGEYGHDIMRFIYDARTSAKINPPEPIVQPLDFKWHGVVKKLRSFGIKVAEDQDIPQELLLRKRDIEALIRNAEEAVGADIELPISLQGWRESIIGAPLLAELKRLEGSAE
jgi:ribonuclease D